MMLSHEFSIRYQEITTMKRSNKERKPWRLLVTASDIQHLMETMKPDRDMTEAIKGSWEEQRVLWTQGFSFAAKHHHDAGGGCTLHAELRKIKQAELFKRLRALSSTTFSYQY